MIVIDDIKKRWLGKLTRLNPNTGRGACQGKAPHKPLLLLALIDLAESGELTTRSFTRSPGLVLRFRSYGSIVADRWPTRLDIKMPFFHLSTQEFWQPLDVEMRPTTGPDSSVVCEMQPDFFALMADADFRLKARLILVTKYFTPTERIALFEGLGLQAGSAKCVKVDNVVQEAVEAAKSKGRNARFAVRVVAGYRYTCALTGYRCVTDDGAAVVDAAHIEQWARTQNDDLANGLALSKTSHWMFDEGLWSADNDLRVIVNARRFSENGPEQLRLTFFVGRHLQFDPAAKLRPSVEYFRNHRAHHGWRG
jgi:putative restriction endonuclease